MLKIGLFFFSFHCRLHWRCCRYQLNGRIPSLLTGHTHTYGFISVVFFFGCCCCHSPLPNVPCVRTVDVVCIGICCANAFVLLSKHILISSHIWCCPSRIPESTLVCWSNDEEMKKKNCWLSHEIRYYKWN